jgi:pimeloyl-ACP methyl ester carboxylesterase
MYLVIFFLTFFLCIAITFFFPEKQPKIAHENGMPLENSITKWENVMLGDCEQWLSIRGADKNNPVLLFLHGGPGTPEIPFLIKYNRDLENIFTVVSWDQRGAGKSFSKEVPPESMNLDQFLADTHELTQYLKEKFGKEKIYLMGHSWGTLLGIQAVHRNPKDYHAYIAVAQTSDGRREELLSYEKVLEQAKKANHGSAVKELEKIGGPKEGKYNGGDNGLGTRLKWVRYFGGAAFHEEKSIWPLIKDVVKTPVYSTLEKLKYPRGEKFSLKHLYDDVRDIQLKKEIKSVKVPVYFFHGVYDNQVPLEVARDFFEGLKAPEKKFTVFDNSAHGVLYEEPEKFHQIMEEVVKKV